MRPEAKCEAGSIAFDFHPDDHIPSPISHLCVWGLSSVLLFLLIRTMLHRAVSNRLVHQANASEASDTEPTVGNRFVYGTVEYADGANHAISVDVEQQGSEARYKTSWTHRWTEIARRTNAVPFDLVRPNGTRIRVEPGIDPQLMTDIDQIVPISRERRKRVARLVAGVQVMVEGELNRVDNSASQHGSNARNDSQTWIMSPKAGERMEVHMDGTSVRYRKRAQDLGQTAMTIFGALVMLHAISLYYHARLFAGEETCATVIDKNITASKGSKGQSISNHMIRLNVDGRKKTEFADTLEYTDWVQVKPGTVIAVRYVRLDPTLSIVGSGTSVHFATILAAALLCSAGILAYKKTPTDRRRDNDRIDENGPGRLPESQTLFNAD